MGTTDSEDELLRVLSKDAATLEDIPTLQALVRVLRVKLLASQAAQTLAEERLAVCGMKLQERTDKFLRLKVQVEDLLEKGDRC